MRKVYYDYYTQSGRTQIVTTDKAYWDKHHALNRGSTNTYYDIYMAMQMSGTYEISESVFALNDETCINDVLRAMTAAGFEMTRNKDLPAG